MGIIINRCVRTFCATSRGRMFTAENRCCENLHYILFMSMTTCSVHVSQAVFRWRNHRRPRQRAVAAGVKTVSLGSQWSTFTSWKMNGSRTMSFLGFEMWINRLFTYGYRKDSRTLVFLISELVFREQLGVVLIKIYYLNTWPSRSVHIKLLQNDNAYKSLMFAKLTLDTAYLIRIIMKSDVILFASDNDEKWRYSVRHNLWEKNRRKWWENVEGMMRKSKITVSLIFQK